MQKERRIKLWQEEIRQLTHRLTYLTDTSLETINKRNELQNKIIELELKITNVRDGLPEVGERSGIYRAKGI